MAPLTSAKPSKPVADDEVMLVLSEARAARFLVDVVTNPSTSYNEDRADTPQMDDHLDWIRSHALDWLRECHDKLEAEYRKFRTGPGRRLAGLGKEGEA